MNSKISLALMGCCLLSIFSVIGLYLFSSSDQRDNSMNRIFPGHVIENEKILDLGYNSWYLAGSTNSHVYFGNTTGARRIFQANFFNGDTTHFILTIPSLGTYHFKSIQIKIDSPYVYLMDGTIPKILRSTIHNTEMIPVDLSLSNYNQCVPIGPSSFGLRIFNKETSGQSLAKTRLTKFEAHPQLLEKQAEGNFSVDGMFHYDKHSARFVYVYFYRNEFLYMDSTLTLLYRGKTIDTTRHVYIKIDTIHSQHSITMAAPPVFVNKQSAVSGQSLYVLSDKLAKNESAKIHERNETIDVYNLRNGTYQFSFYVSPLKKMKMKGFLVSNDKLIALYDHYLVIRGLNEKYFNTPKGVTLTMAKKILLAR